jgi:hypothetical protein
VADRTPRQPGAARRLLAAAAAAACMITAGCQTAPAAATPGSLAKIHDPGRVTGTITGPCHTRDRGRLPDPRCTPGSIDPAVTQANLSRTICVPERLGGSRVTYVLSARWAAGRPPETQTEAFKYGQAERAYGQHHVHGELDHLVARELGGSNAAANLWVEAGPIPNPKDRTESVLHEAVCRGRVTLAAAQEAIAHDWMTAERRLGLARRGPHAPVPGAPLAGGPATSRRTAARRQRARRTGGADADKVQTRCCPRCGYAIQVAIWCRDPACCDPDLASFLAVLLAGERQSGLATFALRILHDPGEYSPDMPIRVWRAGNLTPLYAGPISEAPAATMEHACRTGQAGT